jgi:3-hydroxybutyryl-CoA dehydrogenase
VVADRLEGASRFEERVAIIGAGAMGSGIAQVVLAGGYPVRLHDADPATLSAAVRRIADGLDRWVAKGRLDPGARERALAALEQGASIASAVQDATIVIEAAHEDPGVKDEVFRAIDASAPPGTILATNTSSLAVSERAAATRRPEAVLGLHFFNPAPLMPLVELITTDRTNEAMADRAEAFARSLGKVPVRSADTPGFIVNRVGRPYVVEAVRMLEAGEGSVEGIDAALEASGYPMGPFRLLDLIGLDVDLAIDQRLHDAFFGASRFAPPELQRQLVDQGRLGRKRGVGFYDYGDTAAPHPKPAASSGAIDQRDPTAAPLDVDEIVERLELGVINEAYRAVEDAVALPPVIDEAMRLGAGHPAGPFERVDAIGLRRVVERLRELDAATAGRSGDQYRVAPLLWNLATV